MYVDFTYYTDNFGGTAITAESFNTYERKARVFLDNVTFNRLQTDATLITTIVKDCLCEIMDTNFNLDEKAKETDGNIISSETVDKVTTSYAISDIEKNSIDRSQINKAKYYNIAKEYLPYTGLLYRGV